MIQKNDDIEHLQSFFQFITRDQFNILLLSFKSIRRRTLAIICVIMVIWFKEKKEGNV
jgi:hypothetical protein